MGSGIPSTMPVEFVERFVYLLGEESGAFRPQLGGVVSFRGALDESRLRTALASLMISEPVLGCRFVPDTAPPVWQRVEGFDAVDLLRVTTSRDTVRDAGAFVADPFDPRKGPQMLGALLRGPAGDTLAVKVSHLAVDGGALKEMLYLIAAAYRALDDVPGWTPEPNLDGLRRPLADAGFWEKARAMSANPAMPPSDWPATGVSSSGPAAYVSTALEGDQLLAAVDLGKTAGATVNDILMAAYYRALWRLFGAVPGSRTPLVTSCDLRKYLPSGTKTGLSNISSDWYVSLTPVRGEEFEATLNRVVMATSEWKRSGAAKAAALRVGIADRLMRKRGLGAARKLVGAVEWERRPGLTNIGVIDEERLNFGREPTPVDVFLLGPISPGRVLTTSTFCGRLRLSVGTYRNERDEGLASAVVRETGSEILNWVRRRRTQAAEQAHPADGLEVVG